LTHRLQVFVGLSTIVGDGVDAVTFQFAPRIVFELAEAFEVALNMNRISPRFLLLVDGLQQVSDSGSLRPSDKSSLIAHAL
jgi:hypothetical protein